MENLTRDLTNVVERSTVKRRRPRETRSTSSTREGARSYPLLGAQVLFAIHILVAPLLLGGVYASEMVVIACSGLICLVASAWARSELRVPAPAVVWIALLLLVWTTVQAVLLPCDLVRGVSGGAVEVLTAARTALGWSAPSWCSLSYDPGATRQEIIKGVALVATLLTSWILSAGHTRRTVLWMVAASSLVMSTVALVHTMAGLEEVFGLYRPVEARSGLLLAPLLNANNLGAFAALGGPLWISLTYRHQRIEVRWWGRIATLVTTLTAVLTLSRGAIAQALGTLLFVAGYIYIRSRRSRKSSQAPRSTTAAFGVLGTAAVALALVAYLAGGPVAAAFADGNFSKLALLGRAFAFAADHPWIGVGRGAFASAFLPATHTGVRFGHAENFLAQWASEWGIPVTLLWCSAVLLALWQRLRDAKTLATIGAAIALLGLTAQNLVDLGFEILGVATIAIALLGAILSPSELRARPDGLAAGSLRATVALALFAGVAALLTLGPSLEADSVSSLDARLRTTLDGPRSEFRATLQHAVTLHPAEPLFPILAATEGLRHEDRNTPRWLNHVMQLAPDWGAPHVLAFQWLWRTGHQVQALLELKLAAERDSSWVLGRHLCQLAQLEGELVLSAVPHGKHRRPVLEMISTCVAADSRTSERADELLLRDDPDHPGALERNAFRVARSGEVDEALALFSRLLRTHPDRVSARITRAGVLQLAERYDDLVTQIDRDLAVVPTAERIRLLNIQADTYARLRNVEGVRRAVEAYRSSVGTSLDGLADSYALDGQMQMRLRNFGAALSAFHEAYRINSATRHLLAIAGAANSLGNRGQVIWAYIRLCEREPLGTPYCAERDRMLAAAR